MSPTQYSPVTDTAGRHVAYLLALDAHAGARGDACRDGDADGRGSRSFRVSRRVCVERIGVLPIGSTSINLGLVSYKMDCKLIELKPPILLYTKIHFIFRGPSNSGALCDRTVRTCLDTGLLKRQELLLLPLLFVSLCVCVCVSVQSSSAK